MSSCSGSITSAAKIAIDDVVDEHRRQHRPRCAEGGSGGSPSRRRVAAEIEITLAAGEVERDGDQGAREQGLRREHEPSDVEVGVEEQHRKRRDDEGEQPSPANRPLDRRRRGVPG